MATEPAWRIVSDCRDRLGESPQWLAATGELYWIDFYGPTIRRLGTDGKRTDWNLSGFKTVGSLVPCGDGRLLVAVESGLHLFDPRDATLAFFGDPNEGRADIVYNDAKVDRHGNYWIGNYDARESDPRGIFYCRMPDGRWRIGDAGFVVCNGPAFSPEGDILYFSDTMGRRIFAYDLDASVGALSNRRLFHACDEGDGMPDGMCVDSEGCLWVACYDGGRVMRLSPGGERLETLSLPVRNATSCCLGGPGLRTLLVTTAHAADGSEPDGGALFAVEVPVPGIHERPLGLSQSTP